MNYYRLFLTAIVAASSAFTASGNVKMTVDKNGVMRDKSGNEVSYYGTNYTLPFAHSYREAIRRGKDPKEAIREDVYHMNRLGFNGYRVHLWDVELADSLGNLLPNQHLDLMDYLISELEKRGIDIVLTAQTNFGNGYPERNIDTGSYSYDFEKCNVHDNPRAQDIQENYLRQLARHRNPYTGKTYSDDENIIGMEINNEPCHSDTPAVAKGYINRMIGALRSEGWEKPLFYNASHNYRHTRAFYESDADGMTFQWYPTGLVSGHERKGNLLPSVASYDIPWKDTIPQYARKARMVYEFDPGDTMATYLYPAIVRMFSKEGFQWITQFAYDAMFLAPYNTDYQTHYLNLAYTPGKAISMKIAGEAARELERGNKYGTMPGDTVFGNFRVSYPRDLSDYDNGEKFFHSNNTDRTPRRASTLREIAGVGSSPIVKYPGTGAYFLDKLGDGIWRLEVMPDLIGIADAFERPAPDRRVGRIIWREHQMDINLPDLGKDFFYQGINAGNDVSGRSSGGCILIRPGAYILSTKNPAGMIAAIDGSLREFYAPAGDGGPSDLLHTAPVFALKNGEVDIEVTVAGEKDPESVTLYPSDINFWSTDNVTYPLEKRGEFTWGAKIPVGNGPSSDYWITMDDGFGERTWPGAVKGNPLSWDFRSKGMYSVKNVEAGAESPIAVMLPEKDDADIDFVSIPGETHGHKLEYTAPDGINAPYYTITTDGTERVIFRKYIGDAMKGLPQDLKPAAFDVVFGQEQELKPVVRVVGKSGASYTYPDMTPAPTYIIPAPFPVFLNQSVDVKGESSPVIRDMEFIEIEIPEGKAGSLVLYGIRVITE